MANLSLKFMNFSFLGIFFIFPNFCFSKFFIFNEKLIFIMFLIIMVVSLFCILSKLNNFYKKSVIFNYLISMSMLVSILFSFSSSFFWLFFFFEISIIPIFLMMAGWGYQLERIQASYYLLLYTLIFSFPFMMMIFYFSNMNLSMFFFSLKMKNLSILISFISIMLFLVKSPIYFIHLWLPKAHVESPIMGSILLAGILLKLGSFGLIRILFSICISPITKKMLILLTAIGSILANIIAFFQSDQKSMVAYMSVGHMTILSSTIIMIIFFSIKPFILMMLIHALVSPSLFFISYIFYKNSLNRMIFLNQSFLSTNMFFMVSMIFFLLLNFSIPPFPPFFSEIMFLSCFLFFSSKFYLLILTIVFLGCLYSISLLINMIHGKTMFDSFNNLLTPSINNILMFFMILSSMFLLSLFILM